MKPQTKGEAAIAEAIREAVNEALEIAASLHEIIGTACDHEKHKGVPGAAAMGAVIEYRDAIRRLKQ